MPTHPDVLAADPAPITAKPHITGIRCDADDLDRGRRRRNRDERPTVITRGRRHDATAQERRGQPQRDHSRFHTSISRHLRLLPAVRFHP
jgi:hypothetical protein